MNIHFADLRSPQVKEAVEANAVVVLPVGQTEQHGPHLPVRTDTFVIERVCEEAVRGLAGSPPAYVLDTICYGYSQKVLMNWPGTFILPQEIVIQALRHIMVSLADMGFRKIILASNHGNHDGVAKVAARMLADDRGVGPGLVFPYALVTDVLEKLGKAGPGGSCHAGELETSVMLHLAPELVDMSVAVAGDKLAFEKPYSASQAFISTWKLQKSESGTYGDPTVASPEVGKAFFEKMVSETAKFIRYYHGAKQV